MRRLSERRMETVPCALCRADEPQELFTNDIHGLGLRTVLCRRCGLVYFNPRLTASEYDRFYASEYHRLYPSRAAFNRGRIGNLVTRATAMKRVAAYSPYFAEGGRLLEIGPGEGSFLAAMHSRWPQVECLGIDPSPEEVKACCARGLNVRQSYLEQLAPEEQFTHAALFHVLEHALDPLAMLRSIAEHLLPNGHVFIEVPNILGNWRGLGMIHVAHPYQFSPDTLRYALELAGFECIQVTPLEDDLLACSIRAIARKRAGSFIPQASIAPVDTLPEMFHQRLADWRRTLAVSRIKHQLARCLGPSLTATVWELTSGRAWKAQADQALTSITPVS